MPARASWTRRPCLCLKSTQCSSTLCMLPRPRLGLCRGDAVHSTRGAVPHGRGVPGTVPPSPPAPPVPSAVLGLCWAAAGRARPHRPALRGGQRRHPPDEAGAAAPRAEDPLQRLRPGCHGQEALGLGDRGEAQVAATPPQQPGEVWSPCLCSPQPLCGVGGGCLRLPGAPVGTGTNRCSCRRMSPTCSRSPNLAPASEGRRGTGSSPPSAAPRTTGGPSPSSWCRYVAPTVRGRRLSQRQALWPG